MVSLILLVLLAAGILADIYAGYSRLSLQDFWEIILGGGDPGTSVHPDSASPSQDFYQSFGWRRTWTCRRNHTGRGEK